MKRIVHAVLSEEAHKVLRTLRIEYGLTNPEALNKVLVAYRDAVGFRMGNHSVDEPGVDDFLANDEVLT